MKIKIGANYWLWAQPLKWGGFVAVIAAGSVLPLVVAFTDRTTPLWRSLLLGGLGVVGVAFAMFVVRVGAVVAGPPGIRLGRWQRDPGRWIPWDEVESFATDRWRGGFGVVRKPARRYQVLVAMVDLLELGDLLVVILLIPFSRWLDKRGYRRQDRKIRKYAEAIAEACYQSTGNAGPTETYVLGEVHGPVQRTASDTFVGMNAYAPPRASGPFRLPSERAVSGARRREGNRHLG